MAGRVDLVAAAAGCVVLLALPAAETAVAGSAAEHLDRAVRLLLAPAPTSGDLRAGFVSLLDALIAAGAEAPSAAACRPGLAKARQVASQGSLLDHRTVAALHECYRDTHGGASFRVPDSVRSGGDATAYCRTQFQSARGFLEGGRTDDAFGRMIEAAVLIVTPVERREGEAGAWAWAIGRQWWAAMRAFFQEGFGWLSTARSSSSG